MGLFDIFKKKKPKKKFVPIREPRRIPAGLPRGRPVGMEHPSPRMPEARPPGYGRPPEYERPGGGSRLDVVETKVRTILSELDSIRAELREIRSKLDVLVGRERREYRY